MPQVPSEAATFWLTSARLQEFVKSSGLSTSTQTSRSVPDVRRTVTFMHYLISHASLEKRGLSLSIGQASIYHWQMLAPEHRLYLPFSLL